MNNRTIGLRSPVVFSCDVLHAWASLSARHSTGAHAFTVAITSFPNLSPGSNGTSGREQVSISERVLLERPSMEDPWMISWDVFVTVMTYMRCPLRIEFRKGAADQVGRFVIQIPPDPVRPRATRWRPLFSGDLEKDVEEQILESCSNLYDIRTIRVAKKVGKRKTTPRP